MSEQHEIPISPPEALRSLVSFVQRFDREHGQRGSEFTERQDYWLGAAADIQSAPELTPEQKNYLLGTLIAIEQHLASHDALTGLYNRRELESRFEEVGAHIKRTAKPAALLFLDLDDFKQVNDREGHEEGDKVLVGVAEAMRESIRREDIPCRFGGDEFVIICQETGLEQGKQIAAKILEILAQNQKVRGRVTASIGLAIIDKDNATLGIETIKKSADEALYEAKRTGKGKIVVAGENQ